MFPNVQWGEGGIAPLQANQCPHDGNKELAVEPGLYIHKSKPSHHPTRSKIYRGIYMLLYIYIYFKFMHIQVMTKRAKRTNNLQQVRFHSVCLSGGIGREGRPGEPGGLNGGSDLNTVLCPPLQGEQIPSGVEVVLAPEA